MARMNYNRPNGGYERLSRPNELPTLNPFNKIQRQAWARQQSELRRKHEQVNQDPEITHAEHSATVRGVPGRYALWCNKCACEITALTQEQYQIWRELNPVQLQRVKKQP